MTYPPVDEGDFPQVTASAYVGEDAPCDPRPGLTWEPYGRPCLLDWGLCLTCGAEQGLPWAAMMHDGEYGARHGARKPPAR